MKRRSRRMQRRRARREQRRAMQYKSLGDSPYARKVRAGQFYGPMPQVPKFPDFRPGWRFVP